MQAPSRWRFLVVLVSAVAIGLAVQTMRQYPWADAAGTICYVAAAIGAVGVLRPGRWLPAVVGTGLACAVELLQLTPLPGRVTAALPPARLLLGGSFDPGDLLVLIAGGIGVGVLLTLSGHNRGDSDSAA